MYRLSSLLSHDNYIPVSKILASKIGLLEATLFGELCAESDYWHSRNEVTEDGYFFSTVENIEEKLFIKKDVQQRILKKLVNENLISISKRGLPAKRYIKINEEILAKQLTENDLSSRRNFRQLDDGISATNKTISNKTIHNNTLSHDISYKKKKFIPPTVEEVQKYIEEINSSIDAQFFVDYYTDNNWKDKNDNPVKNWKLKLRTWEMRERKNKSSYSKEIITPSEEHINNWYNPEMEAYWKEHENDY